MWACQCVWFLWCFTIPLCMRLFPLTSLNSPVHVWTCVCAQRMSVSYLPIPLCMYMWMHMSVSVSLCVLQSLCAWRCASMSTDMHICLCPIVWPNPFPHICICICACIWVCLCTLVEKQALDRGAEKASVKVKPFLKGCFARPSQKWNQPLASILWNHPVDSFVKQSPKVKPPLMGVFRKPQLAGGFMKSPFQSKNRLWDLSWFDQILQ